jgi:hypothetical protein
VSKLLDPPLEVVPPVVVTVADATIGVVVPTVAVQLSLMIGVFAQKSTATLFTVAVVAGLKLTSYWVLEALTAELLRVIARFVMRPYALACAAETSGIKEAVSKPKATTSDLKRLVRKFVFMFFLFYRYYLI